MDNDSIMASESAELIEYMMSGEGQKRPEGQVKVGDVLSDADSPVPVVVGDAETLLGQPADAGYVYVFYRKTGEPVLVNKNNLPTQMKKAKCVIACNMKKCTHERERVFTLTDPGFRPQSVANVPCRLHPSDPERERWDRYGFSRCGKYLKTTLDRDIHMEKRHQMENKTIISEKLDAERKQETADRKEDREFQRKLLTKLVGDTEKKGK